MTDASQRYVCLCEGHMSARAAEMERRAGVTLPQFVSGRTMTKGKRHRPEAVMSGRVLRPGGTVRKPGASHGRKMIRIETAATDQANRIRIFNAPNVRWRCRSKCFLPPIRNDKRGSVRPNQPTARIQALTTKVIALSACIISYRRQKNLPLVDPSPAVARLASKTR